LVAIRETTRNILAWLDVDVAAIAEVAVIAGTAPLPVAIDARRVAAECPVPADRFAIGKIVLPRDAATSEEDLAVTGTRNRCFPRLAIELATAGVAVLEVDLAIRQREGVGLTVVTGQCH